jgi:serine/threonine protein kinase
VAVTVSRSRDEQALVPAINPVSEVQVPYVGRYLMLSSVDRRAGGQGVVLFARGNGSAKEYAVKFYTQLEAFSRERDLYMEPCLREMMPATQEIIGNEDAAIRMPDGFVFPPCIVIEKGESLDVWAIRERHDFVTVLQVLCHVAERLKVLHAAGWVHRDLKPGNVLRRPEQHSWTLIDFGCTARIGAIVAQPLAPQPSEPHLVIQSASCVCLFVCLRAVAEPPHRRRRCRFCF